MTRAFHALTGVVVTGALIYYTPVAVVPGVLGVFGSYAADYDGRLGLKHRGISHSLLAPFILGLIAFVFSPSFGIVFGINYLIHIVLDSFTVMGVPLLMPVSKKYFGLKLIRTGGEVEIFMLLALLWIITEVVANF